PRKAGLLAFVCSFAVYFIPLVGPHALFFVHETIWRQLRGSAHWAAGDLGVAIALQLGAFAIFYWLCRRRGGVLPILAVLVYGAAATVLSQYVYMLWLPSHFLIEAETAPETG